MTNVQFDTVIWKEGDVYVSYCPKLDVSSCGDTIDEARRMIKEAVTLFIEEAEKMGTLNNILEEAGYTRKKTKGESKWEAPAVVSSERMEARVE